MDWDGIVRLGREALGESLSDFYTDQGIMLIASQIQAEIAESVLCVKSHYKFLYIPCAAVSTGNLTLTGEQTVNGQALTSDMACLVADQTNSTENGIYTVATGAWVRHTYLDAAADVQFDVFAGVANGTYNEKTTWKMSLSGTIGTDAMTFTKVSDFRHWEIPFPVDFISPHKVRMNDIPCDQNQVIEDHNNYPSGQPTTFYLDGTMIGFNQSPGSAMYGQIEYAKRTSEWAFRTWYDDDAGSGTSCTFKVSDTSVVYTIIGGSDAGTHTFTFATSGTVGELVTAINAYGANIFAVAANDIRGDNSTTNLSRMYVAQSCFGYNKHKYAFFDIEIPTTFNALMHQGVLDGMKLRNGELSAEQYMKATYMFMLKQKTASYHKRSAGVNMPMFGGGSQSFSSRYPAGLFPNAIR